MKRSIIFLMIFSLAVVMCCMNLQAAPSASKNITVNAVVPNLSVEIDITILKFTDGNDDKDPWSNSTEVTSMSFGALTNRLADGKGAGLWYAEAGFCVNVYAQGYGHKYEVKSTCTGLASGSNRLPDNSFGLTPVYSADDLWDITDPTSRQGDMPTATGAQLGSSGSAVATDMLIYRSDNPSTARIIQAYYGLPPYEIGGADPFPDFERIPLSQASGTYTGTVTITIVAI
ncbi:MAG: hypothetical protein ABH815_03365 [Candidatus Omnitrophota bacterium]